MLSDESDLLDLGLEISPTAMLEIRAAETCALCGHEPLRPDASEEQVFAWLDAHEGVTEADSIRSLMAGGEPHTIVGRSGTDNPRDWEGVRPRAIADSQLRAALPIPVDLLHRVTPQMDAALSDFVPSELAVAVCHLCFYSSVQPNAAGATLRRAYVSYKFGGNDGAAMKQPSWELVERFLRLVEAMDSRVTGTG
jgi:hypothetical protein